MNITVVSTSIRNKSNSEILAHEFEKGALAAGCDVDFITLKDKSIEYCKGCLSCQRTGKCVIKDDVESIMQTVKNSDVICFATPIYYYGMSGQMKTLLDRLNPLYSSDYRFKSIYLIATSADEDKDAINGTITGLNGWISCFERASLKNTLHAGGLNDPDSANDAKNLLSKAYDLGFNVN